MEKWLPGCPWIGHDLKEQNHCFCNFVIAATAVIMYMPIIKPEDVSEWKQAEIAGVSHGHCPCPTARVLHK